MNYSGTQRNNKYGEKNPQEDVAEKLHTVQSGYSHYEQGIYLIPTAFLHELTKIYKKFSIDALFGRISK